MPELAPAAAVDWATGIPTAPSATFEEEEGVEPPPERFQFTPIRETPPVGP